MKRVLVSEWNTDASLHGPFTDFQPEPIISGGEEPVVKSEDCSVAQPLQQKPVQLGP